MNEDPNKFCLEILKCAAVLIVLAATLFMAGLYFCGCVTASVTYYDQDTGEVLSYGK